jgi:hypothetical protein
METVLLVRVETGVGAIFVLEKVAGVTAGEFTGEVGTVF